MTNPPTDQPAALPLHELEIAPQWVRAPSQSFENHAGEEQERKRKDRRPGRQRRPHSPSARVADKPRKPFAARTRGDKTNRVRPRPETVPPPVPVEVAFLPEEKGFAAMMETMKQSSRAYSLFDIAKLVLNKPERHLVRLTRPPAADGTRPVLFLIVANGNPYLSQEEALRFVFRRDATRIFKETRKPIDPPKGNFTFVSRCGLTGEILGPPNYHEYQSRLVRHHQSRLRHVPFEKFKAQLQTVRDAEAIKAWIESKSYVAEYQCLLDSESPTFVTREELEEHVIEKHLEQLVAQAAEVSLSGSASRHIAHGGILEAIRQAWLTERRFPLRTATALSEHLRKEGFQFFKHDKAITYIARIKPRHLEATQELTEHVRRIVSYLREHQHCTRKDLFAALSPATDGTEAADIGLTQQEEQLLADLHWVIQDGYVVEFADGRLWVPDEKPAPPPAAADATPATPALLEPTPDVAQHA